MKVIRRPFLIRRNKNRVADWLVYMLFTYVAIITSVRWAASESSYFHCPCGASYLSLWCMFCDSGTCWQVDKITLHCFPLVDHYFVAGPVWMFAPVFHLEFSPNLLVSTPVTKIKYKSRVVYWLFMHSFYVVTFMV